MRRVELAKVAPAVSGPVTTRTVHGTGAALSEVTFDVGARWTRDVGLATDSEHCEKPHFGLVLEGSLGSRMRDGQEQTFFAGDVLILSPGHDVWTEGPVRCVFVDFTALQP